MTNHQHSLKPFGLRDKIGYLFGDFGNDFTFILSSSFLLKFYTDVMGVSAAVVGLIMMLARFVDGFTDVTMGRICDRSKTTAHGKFKPWLLKMCGPVALSSFLIYQSAFKDSAMWFKITWLVITYILWGSIFYTSINIPYGSMASAISPDPSDRQSLSTYRTMGATIAGTIIGVVVPLVVYENKVIDGTEVAVMQGGRFTVVAGILSLLAIAGYLLCYYLTTERVRPQEDARHRRQQHVGKLLLRAVKNRALLSIVVASVVMLLAQLTMQQMANYVYPNYYGNPAAMSVSTLAMMAGMIVAAAIAKPLARKFGKAEISVVSNLVAAGICFLLFLLSPKNVWVFVVLNLLSWFGLGIFSMVNWALITDVIDDSELQNGIREDGSIYALYSFARKLGQAASAGLVGILLQLVGYSDATAFDPSVTQSIFNISTLVPAFGFAALALILWFWYPLHKKRVDRNVELLQEKRKQTEQIATKHPDVNASVSAEPNAELAQPAKQKTKPKK